jgi:glutamate-1-semialdehyde 2,1-aminomutase
MEIMQHIAPLGKVYQAGTLSGNPLAMAAGHALLSILKDDPTIYTQLNEKGNYLNEGLSKVLVKHGVKHVINQLGSMISLHFSEQPVIDFDSAANADNTKFNALFHQMLKRGIYLPPSAFETWFISNALSYDDLDYTINAVDEIFTAGF